MGFFECASVLYIIIIELIEELAKLSEEASQMIVEALSSRQDLINKLDSENSLMQVK